MPTETNFEFSTAFRFSLLSRTQSAADLCVPKPTDIPNSSEATDRWIDRPYSPPLLNTTEFVPKFLARREKAKAAASLGAAAAAAAAAAEVLPEGASRVGQPKGPPPAPTPAAPPPPALSSLPRSFHKRYLMNFTVLSPEQQRAAQEAERKKRQQEAEEMRGNGGRNGSGNGWRGRRGGGPRGWDGAASGSDDPGKAALRELARRGVLEREEVKAMLAPGPLQDFRGSVLQVTG